MKKKEKILLYGSNLWFLGAGMLGPLFAVFAEKIGGNILDISFAYAVYMLVTGVFTIFIGKLSDLKISKENLMVTGFFLNAIFTFAYIFVSTPVHLFLIQVGFGLSLALSIPTWDALYAKYHDKRSSGYSWGLAAGQGYVITGLAVIIGGIIVNYLSFNILFVVMGIIELYSAFYIAKIYQD